MSTPELTGPLVSVGIPTYNRGDSAGAPVAWTDPLVSVGIPTYNRPEGLRRTLGCLVNQTHRHLDIIVSDNGSPDGRTEAVVREFQRTDDRIRCFRQPANRGWDHNFKFVLRQARGAFFFFAADDDEWTPDFVAVCLAHSGGVGTVMTNMQRSVRPRGLLRPMPPIRIAADASPFENARAFLEDLQQNCLFYGLHRTETLRPFLGERMGDFYDCFFVLRQILTHGIHVIPQVCFTIGLDSEEQSLKPARPRHQAVYEYLPFFRNAASVIVGCRKLTPAEKGRLLYLLSFQILNEFAWFERPVRPRRAWLAAYAMRLLRPLHRRFGVNLPLPPPALRLPADAAEVCFVHVPHQELQSVEGGRRQLDEAQGQLQEKERVIAGLEPALASRALG